MTFVENKNEVLNLIYTTQEAVVYMHEACLAGDENGIRTLAADIEAAYRIIMSAVDVQGVSKILFLYCESILDSLRRTLMLLSTAPKKYAHKLEFELIPLVQNLYALYYYEIASQDAGLYKKYIEYDRFPLWTNRYVDESEENGAYKYEVSITVTGYNKLEYTRACVDSLLKHIPEGLNYELILMNHGSSDGTKAFFESVQPHKQLDLYRNGCGGAIIRTYEGKYLLSVSNDVLITQGAIENMLSCIKSAPDIIFVVPTTPNVSNLQSINVGYSDITGMYAFAERNNIMNPLMWEQRTRLCNPVTMLSIKDVYSIKGIQSHSYIMSDNMYLFPDDKLSYLVRKAGKKMMLAKDAYCYHYGSVTLKDEVAKKNEQEYYLNGRKTFKKAFGIDPWGKGFCYDPNLFTELQLQKKDDATILGISPGIGSNPLKIKTMLYELGSDNTRLFLTTEEEHFKPDYESYTNAEYVTITGPKEFKSVFPQESFDYITLEYPPTINMITALQKRLKKGGKLLVYLDNVATIRNLQQFKPPKMKIDGKTHMWFLY
jgi:GT2 family glycosyltransferase